MSLPIVLADAREWLTSLPDASVDCVATDPPYNTGLDFGAYNDGWQSMDAYVEFMHSVMSEVHRVLQPAGSLWLQCDWHADSYLRVMLDTLFGPDNFRNSICWPRKYGLMSNQHTPRRFPVQLDTILYYAKSDAAMLHPFIGLSLEDQAKMFPHVATDGRRYNWDGSLYLSGFHRKNGNIRDSARFEWRGHTPANGWCMSRETLDAEFQRGDIKHSNGTLKRRRYMHPKGKLIGNLWDDIKPRPRNKSAGYPTQKPLALYERIISVSSVEGDLVVDPFCGSGTTLLAAKRLDRRFMGCDVNPEAVNLAKQRIRETLL